MIPVRAMSADGLIGGPGLGLAAFANALARAGYGFASGAPPSAELVLVALGGVGFHYALVGAPLAHRVAFHGVAGGLTASGRSFHAAAAAFGAELQLQTWEEDDGAEAGLHAALHAPGAVLVWTDLAALPYDPLPKGYQRSLAQLVGVVGHEGTDYLLDDRAAIALPVDGHRLRLARDLCPVGGRTLVQLSDPAPAA